MNPNKQPNLQQMLSDKKKLQQVAQSQEAKALANMLTQSRDQSSLQEVAAKAAKGDTTELSQLIRSIMSQPEGAKLLQKLNESFDK